MWFGHKISVCAKGGLQWLIHMEGDFPKLGRQNPNNGLRLVLEEAERLQAQYEDLLDDYLDACYILFGMIPNATRRIITELKSTTPQDDCAFFHASRIFNNGVGAFLLLRKGMLTEAVILIRATLESTAQTILFMRDSEAAKKWINGKRYRPKEVRKKLGGNPDFAPLYKQLSEIAHANPQGRWSHSIYIDSLGYAVFYGGSYQPKRVANLLAILAEIIVIYLDAFYEHYKNRLSVEFWPVVIDFGSMILNDLRKWSQGLPDDSKAISAQAENMRVSPMTPLPIDKATRNKLLEAIEKRRAKESL